MNQVTVGRVIGTGAQMGTAMAQGAQNRARDPEPMSELQEQAARLEGAISLLSQSLAHVRTRVEPLMRPTSTPQSDTDSKALGGPGSAHGQFLDACTRRVDMLTADVQDLLQRLAV
jgi:hypothetical protein